eukprot:gene11613-8002_t
MCFLLLIVFKENKQEEDDSKAIIVPLFAPPSFPLFMKGSTLRPTSA